MTPELQLVIAAARVRPSPLAMDRIAQILAGTLDWSLVLALAAAHSVRPPVLKNLAAFMPTGQRDRLQSECAAISAHNLLLAGELAHVMTALTNAGIPALAFKGPVLAQQLHGDVTLREFSDLDIQAPRHLIWQAVEILRPLGYECELGRGGRAAEAYLDSECELMLTHPAGHSVDLHWAFSASFYRPFPLLVPSHPQSVQLFGAEIRTFSPADCALFAIGHFYRHGCWSAKGVADTAAVLERLSSDQWLQVLDAAAAMGCRRMVLFAARAAVHFHQARLPPAAGIGPGSGPKWLAGAVAACERMIVNSTAGTPGAIPRLRLRLSQIDSPLARIRHATHWLVAPRKALWLSHPKPALLLHCLTHPLADRRP
ncbi:MAG: hypothetical protein C0504_12270 [Candidatus Solibacter sp.]|nr:hypothetical protein [Candidatus Solibacter sp.]